MDILSLPDRRSVLGGLAALLAAGPAIAQPDLSRPMGPTIADQGSAFYRFDRVGLVSRDGGRRYRVTVGMPRRPAPAAGYPVLHMLDGNAALGVLTEPLLENLDRDGPPVLVAIGYETDRRFDVVARAFDYTPPTSPAGETWENRERGRRGGGADAFLDLIEAEIKPRVAALAAVDPARQALWGHSYGGLFTLHCLFTRPDRFSTYIAASPSLWWQDGFILSEEARFTGAPARLLLTRGGAEGRRREGPRPAGGADAVRQAPPPGREGFPAHALPQMAARLRTLPGLSVEVIEFPDLSHGEALAASLPPALRFAAGFAGGIK
ncbi:alpha/beta hydrolase [Rhodocista pekingensis]|uniref:Alpha/beta hydrolase n=1 Tax=Rhodocista pekingensis TaxID=201185 RepID=A0ABW2KZC5_9PROT